MKKLNYQRERKPTKDQTTFKSLGLQEQIELLKLENGILCKQKIQSELKKCFFTKQSVWTRVKQSKKEIQKLKLVSLNQTNPRK
ncbi:hypothetical protein OXYTRIMIC_540 [Oxytricha trifallax]|uniref:Uncharacterized protein n=1 Tax=Oxytricha trifallax TaxID=1172189 RepID=A0A073HZR9_9SPIT|nr:hypothetical protein OXYTRIMIC_540 [Oxytricha trifallax]